MAVMKALVCQGGWNGHTPEQTAQVLAGALTENGFKVRVADTLAPLADTKALKKLDLIIPVWTMGQLEKEQLAGLNEAVQSGVGLGGVHGGMCDAFRGSGRYQWMTGGQFLAHPHVGDYIVQLTDVKSPITKGLPKRFKYRSEQYYMMVDPSITVLAETIYKHEGRRIRMPVVWTKPWGKGRVFFSALGHVAEEFTQYPHVLDMTTRGLLWAAKRKKK